MGPYHIHVLGPVKLFLLQINSGCLIRGKLFTHESFNSVDDIRGWQNASYHSVK